MPDVFHPGGAFVSFDPEVRIDEIAKQSPLACAVTPANSPTLGHCSKEREDVFIADEIFDGHNDGAAAWLNINCDLRFTPETERVKIERRQWGQGRVNAESSADNLAVSFLGAMS